MASRKISSPALDCLGAGHLTGGQGSSSLPDARRSFSSDPARQKVGAAPGLEPNNLSRRQAGRVRQEFPPLASQDEISAERRETILRRAERIAEFFAVAVITYAIFVFAGVLQ